jgi:signal transduction histidine kinase
VSAPPKPEAVAELISELGHELKTPIAVIAGYAELLGARGDERTRLDASSQIQAAARRLTEAVDELLQAIERDGDLASALLAARAELRERT